MTESHRVYGGVDAGQRRADRRAALVEAGLDLLGAPDGGEQNLTVRGVCRRAGLVSRYFYESFADRDALLRAVYDHAVERIATRTLQAITESSADTYDRRAIVRVGVATIVGEIDADPRLGRLIFSVGLAGKVFAQQRAASSRMFAALVTAQASADMELSADHLDLTAHFVVGGLAQVLTSWLDGTLEVPAETVVGTCTDLLLSAAQIHLGPAS